MKRFIKMLGATACAAVLMCTSVFADNSAQVLNLLKDGRYIATATEAYLNEGTPVFFVKDMNNDGNLEIYVMTYISGGRTHADSANYLISFVNGKPQCTRYAGDSFYGFNPETGVFVNSCSGTGWEAMSISKLNKDGTVSTLHNIGIAYACQPYSDEQKRNVASDGNFYGIQIDNNPMIYFRTKAEMERNKASMLSYYSLQGVGPYPMTSSSYGPAVNSAIYKK